MNKWLLIGSVVVLVPALALSVWWLIANAGYRRAMAEAEAAWSDIAGRAEAPETTFDPTMVSDMPEIAQRYFAHAIAPGTALATAVELKMEGTFLLGDKQSFRTFEMRARQILAPPSEFVWIADMNAGPIRVSGTDALFRQHAWTRFWMFWSIPLVQAAATEGLDRAAAARPALEAIWAPAALLPRNGARWEQIGPDTARVTFGSGDAEIVMELTLDENGGVAEIATQRWSDANPEKKFRLQPFGGTMEKETTFGGFTIPSVVHVGNHFGTDDYFAFFNAAIIEARYR